MPSQLHEALLLLFRNRPQLAPELLRQALNVTLPDYSEIRVESADLTQVQPPEYRADLVVLLLHDKPVLGIVLEVQLHTKPDKRFTWPAYVVNLRSRIRCPVLLLVVSPRESVARWCAQPIDLGGGNLFQPLVVGPAGVPIVVDEVAAKRDPELAVLSAMAHGQDADSDRALQIAMTAITASLGLDAARSTLYFDLVVTSLSEANRRRLQAMDPAKYEYQSEFAKRYLAQGEAKGESRGRAITLLKLLQRRFGQVPENVVARVQSAPIEELDRWAERILDAKSIDDTLQ